MVYIQFILFLTKVNISKLCNKILTAKKKLQKGEFSLPMQIYLSLRNHHKLLQSMLTIYFIWLFFAEYVLPLSYHHEQQLPQGQSTIFTSQVINHQNPDFSKSEDAFQAHLVQQAPKNSLEGRVQASEEFQAQGTKKEKKVGTPKWRLGAGAFLNKEIDEGSTEKETTFIPTIIELKSSDSESDSDEEDSDCDSSSESDGKRNNKKKKTFKLFSLDEVITDKENQKIVVERTVGLKNATTLDYSLNNHSDVMDAMFDSKGFILQIRSLAYICLCSVYLFLI